MASRRATIFAKISACFLLLSVLSWSSLRLNQWGWHRAQPAQAAATFASAVNYSVGSTPRGAFAADFDKDGDIDLASSNTVSNNISVLLNNGNGTYAAAVNYAAGSFTYRIYGADFDRDGDIDLAANNFVSQNVSVFLNNGDGTFAAAVNYSVAGGVSPRDIFAADFNKDGAADLVVATGQNLQVLLGNGDGTFAAAVTYDATGNNHSFVRAGDLDLDGDLDLISSDESIDQIRVLMNNGNGTFASATTYSLADVNPFFAEAADMDRDGDLDVVFLARGTNAVGIMLNNGSGVLAAPTYYSMSGASGTTTEPTLRVSDLDNDGDPDVAVVSSKSNELYIFLNNGTGALDSGTAYAAATSNAIVVTGDLDGDGDRDVATANANGNTVSVYLNTGTNTGSGTFNAAVNVTSASPSQAAAADFNNDGSADLAVVRGPANQVNIFFNAGNGTFGAATAYAVGNSPYAVYAADLNNDGKQDLAVTNSTGADVSVLLNNGDGTFAAATNYAVGTTPTSVLAADVNGDGKLDLLVANRGSNSVSVLINSGTGTFAAAVNYAAGSLPFTLFAADYNKDGKIDVAACNFVSDSVSVFINNGDGTFAAAVNYSVGTTPEGLYGADVNTDGAMDLFTGNVTTNNVSVLINNGDGTFAAAVNYATGTETAGVFAADLNLDGKPDIAAAVNSAHNVAVLLNNGSGTFAAAVNYSVGSTTEFVTGADLNKDGHTDLIATSNAGGFAAVLTAFIPNDPPILGYTADNVIPTAQVAQATNGSGTVTLTFKVRDTESNNVTLKSFGFSTDGGSNWTNISDASAALGGNWPSNGGGGFSTTPSFGTAYTFTVNTKHSDVLRLNTIDSATMKFRFKANDGTNDSAFAVTDAFSLDNKPPEPLTEAKLVSQPSAGATTVTISGSFTETHPGTNVFAAELNGGGYGPNTSGQSGTATPANQATTLSATADGDDRITKVKVTHTDAFGNATVNETSMAGTLNEQLSFKVPAQPTFDAPVDVVKALDGNLWVVDRTDAQLIRMNPSAPGVERRYGSFGSGNGQFSSPQSIAINSDGVLYVVDTGNNRVQRFDSEGNFLSAWGSSGSGNGQFSSPYGIAIDSYNNVYISDRGNNRIQKFDASGAFLLTWGSAGAATGQFNQPGGVGVDSSGNIYVADRLNSRVQKFTNAGVYISSVTQGTEPCSFNPDDVNVDSAGNIYIVLRGSHVVTKFDSSGNYVQILTTNGGCSNTEIDGATAVPEGSFIDSSDNIYIADTGNWRVQELSTTGTFINKWGSGRSSANGYFYNPIAITRDPSGNIFTLEQSNFRVQKFDANGNFVTKWGSSGSGDGQFSNPQDIASDSSGNIYVVEGGNNRVQKFTNNGVFVTKWGSSGSGDGQFSFPQGIAVDSSDNVYVDDSFNYRIQKFTSSGVFVTKWGSNGSANGQFNQARGMAFDSLDRLYVADSNNTRVQIFDANGTFINKWGTSGSGNGQFSGLTDVYVDAFGNVYTSETSNRLQKFTNAGVFIANFGATGVRVGQFQAIYSMTATGSGQILAIENTNHRLQVFSNIPTVVPYTPSAPAVTTAASSANVVVVANGAETGAVQYAIKFASPSVQYVQADGTLGSWPVYLTYAGWGSGAGVTVTGLTNGIAYTVSVQARNPNGDNPVSAYSATASVTPAQSGGSIQVRQLPMAPFAGVGEARDTGTIRWNFTDRASNEDGFRLYDAEGHSLVQLSAPNQSWIEETGLEGNTRYEGRRVKAYNSSGESSASDVFASVLTPMPSVTALVIQQTADSLKVGTTETVPNLDQGQSGLQFELMEVATASGRRARAAAIVQSPWVQTPDYTFTGLQPSHDYNVRVHARNQDGVETDWSTFTATQTTQPGEVITQPTPEPAPEVVPAPTPMPSPEETMPVEPPTQQEVQNIEKVVPPPAPAPAPSPVPTPSSPAPTTVSNEGPSFTVETSTPTQSIVVTGYGAVDGTGFTFTGTSAPNTTITLIFNNNTIVMTTSDAMGEWQTYVSAEQLGIKPGDTRNIRIETIAVSGDLQSARVPVGEVNVALHATGELQAEFLTTLTNNVAVTAFKQVQTDVKHAIQAREPQIQTTLAVTLPAIVIASAPIWGYLPYVPTLLFHALSYLLAALGSRKRLRRRFYGVVYDSISKQPLALAIIRVYRIAQDGSKKLINTVVSDARGRYDALLEPGRYSLEVTKPSYQFPSRIVNQDIDASFEHVYHPEQGVSVEGEQITIPDVPLDPVNTEKVWQTAHGAQKVWMAIQRVGSYLDVPVLLTGTLASFAVLAAVPDKPLNWVLAIVYVGMLTMALRVHTQVLKAWGVVYDLASNAVLPLTTIQLIDPSQGKVVSSRLTDYKGRFSFMPEPGHYVVKASKPGYEQIKEVMEAPKDHHPQTEIDIKKRDQRIVSDVAMRERDDRL